MIRGKDTLDGMETDTMRAISVEKVATGKAGEIIAESLGKAKCELETNRISCENNGAGVGCLLVSCGLPVRIKNSTSFFFSVLFCFDFLLSSFFFSLLFFCSFFLFEKWFSYSLRWPPTCYVAEMSLKFSGLLPSKCWELEGTHPRVDFTTHSWWLHINSSFLMCLSFPSVWESWKRGWKQTPRRETAERLLPSFNQGRLWVRILWQAHLCKNLKLSYGWCWARMRRISQVPVPAADSLFPKALNALCVGLTWPSPFAGGWGWLLAPSAQWFMPPAGAPRVPLSLPASHRHTSSALCSPLSKPFHWRWSYSPCFLGWWDRL